ncbi:hypothetical protein M407DRAFT_247048 [Tulasnella calospora MUT 4182]|uniref:Uncharacterized protein n=1 Tax=Tulasnella calospora MUT 4182 TaxID=1051891 RepID=A0A0C3K415_9AGAM|nr:hypothetical protein M407DRAFT_247048 [Tulasnella calospora MUT 4182]
MVYWYRWEGLIRRVVVVWRVNLLCLTASSTAGVGKFVELQCYFITVTVKSGVTSSQ